MLFVLVASLTAHDLARSESRLEIQGATVQCQLIVDLLEFPGVDQDGNGTISYAELDRSITSVFARVKQHLVLRAPAEPATILMTRHELMDEHMARLDLAYTFPATVSRLAVTSTFDQLARRPEHQHYVTALLSGGQQQAILDASNRTITFENRRWTRTSIWLTVAAVLVVGVRSAFFVFRRKRRA